MTIFAKLGITGDKDARLAEYEHRLARATADAGEHSASVADWQAKKRRRKRGGQYRVGCYCTTTACGTKHCKCVAAGVMCTADCSCEGDPSKCRNQHNHAHAAAPAGAAPPHYSFIDDDDDDFVELRGTGHPSLFVKMAGAVVRFFAKAKPAAKAPLPPPPTPPPPADEVCSLSVSPSLSFFDFHLF